MLTDTTIKNAKPREKQYKLYDEKGLYVLVRPTGGKLFQQKYRDAAGKEKTLSHGQYPDVSLKEAREKRDEARKQIANGVDPGAHKKALKTARRVSAANSFEAVAREWYSKQVPTWAPGHAARVLGRLENDVFPYIGPRPIKDVTAGEGLDVLRRIEGRVVEIAHRVYRDVVRIADYAVITGRAEINVFRGLNKALTQYKPNVFPVPTKGDDIDIERLGEILKAIDGCPATMTIKTALKLAPLVFVRPGELRKARWADIDLDKAEWRFTASKTDMKHIVPLSRQAVEVLREIQPLTQDSDYVFPSARGRGRPMSDSALVAALRNLEIGKDEMVVHSWRAIARTLLDEDLVIRPDFIEHQLAHAVRDPNGRSYNRTAHLEERTAMMQLWADAIDAIRGGTYQEFVAEHKKARKLHSGNVVSFNKAS